MRSIRLLIPLLCMLLSAPRVFAAKIDIGPQPYPNLYITTPTFTLKWLEMYTGLEGVGNLGACYSVLNGDAMDGHHIGVGIANIFATWPYAGLSFAPSVDISWGKLYEDSDKKFFLYTGKMPLSLLVQLVRIDNAALNLYAGGSVAMSGLSLYLNGDNYQNASSLGFQFPYGYHFGLQASVKYAGLALTAVAGMQSMRFRESTLEYDNLDDGNTYFFKMPAETIRNYLYGLKLSIIPWNLSLSYTVQTFKKSDTTGFPEFTQHTFLITYRIGQSGDEPVEKKEERPKQRVDEM